MIDRASRGLALFFNWFNGVCAVACGALMMTGLWNDVMPLSIFDGFPLHDVFFTSLFWPGLALSLVNGLPNVVALAFRFRGNRTASYAWGVVAGILLIVWTIVETVYMPNAITMVYLVVGLAQLAVSGRALRVWKPEA